MTLEGAHKDRPTILNFLANATASAFSRSGTEPQLVANAVWEIPKTVNSVDFQNIFHRHGIHISAGGIFVHARPRVKSVAKAFPKAKPESIEIGDLLVLVHHRFNGYSANSALLLQAKILRRWPPDPDNVNQHHLYAHWPEFEYKRSGQFFNGKRRAVGGPLLYSGAKYLVISPGGSGPCWMECFLPNRYGPCQAFTGQPSQPHPSGFRCFATELYDLLFHNAGRPYRYQPGPSDIGWNRVITDLVDGSANSVSRFMARTEATSDVRGQGIFHFLTGKPDGVPPKMAALFAQGVPNHDNAPPDVPDTWGDANDDYGSGLSMVSISMADREVLSG